jgi:DNA polymerase-4
MEPVSVDEAFLDITGSYHFYQTPLKTCQAIKDRIKKEIQLTASIGIAPVKMVAKIASDLCKPDGLLEVQPDKVLDFLWPLPIQKLWGVGPQTQKALNGLGIKTIGELAKYPVEALSSQLGIHGQHLSDLANGIDAREVYVDEEVKSVSHEHTFDVDTANLKEIYSTLSYLSEKVSRRLRKHDLKGKTLTLKVRLSDFKTVTRAHSFPQRLNFFEDIYGQSKDLFDAFHRPSMKIRLLGVRMSHFTDPYVQDSLFEGPGTAKKEKVHKAIDRIKDKFGERAIHRGRDMS